MPCVNLQILANGPVIDVHIGYSTPKRQALEAIGKQAPQPHPARLLIDTGASCTCIDSAIVKALNLEPTGSTTMHTPSTTEGNGFQCSQYDICLTIPHSVLSRYFHAIPVVESEFAHQGIDGLLGRDVLAECVFIYNGELGIYTLSI